MPFRIIGYDGASYRSQLLSKAKNIVADDTREIQHVDEVLKLLSIMTKDDSYRNILYQEDKKQENEGKSEVKTMCEVAEHLKNIGKSEGLREGLLQKIEIKLAKGKTKEQIADELELTMEETVELLEQVTVSTSGQKDC